MAHILFTSDFHELVRGQLKPGKECLLHYDPQRIMSGRSDYIHGSPDFNFIAHAQYLPQGGEEVRLVSETGVLREAVLKENGQGSMLTAALSIPAGLEEIILWVSMTDTSGKIYYDSDFGRNFHFRTSGEDVTIVKAEVASNKSAGVSKFDLEATSVPAVETAMVRYRITNSGKPFEETCVALQRTIGEKGIYWKTGDIAVPFGSVVVYDLIYFIEGNRYKMDNNGNYYVADIGNAS
jgi:hypothetical protein